MNKQEYKYSFKIIVLGERDVGKTSLTERFTENIFHSEYKSSLGFDFRSKSLNIENISIITKIMAPDPQYYYLLVSFMSRKCNGIILTYDISNRDSFIHLQNIFEIVELNTTSDVRKILIGNKYDKSEREVTEDEGKKLADEFNINFFETSAKTGYNVNEAFECLIRDILKNGKRTDEIISKLEKNGKKFRNKKCMK